MGDNHVFVLAGLPGSGKSTAAEFIVDELKNRVEFATHVEVSDYVRHRYEYGTDETVNDNELGEWAAEQKRKHGQGYFVDALAEDLESPYRPHTVISGVRSPEEVEALQDRFENVTVITIWTLPDIRFERKYGDWEDSENVRKHSERKERELFEWGLISFFINMEISDYIVPNNGSEDGLRSNMQTIVRQQVGDLNVVDSWTEPPFPSNDPEIVAQYL